MYDYVIVGAGSAGCALADRLSAEPGNHVCLLEAGPRDNRPWVRWPTGTMFLLRGGKRNWGFDTAPQAGLNRRQLYWPRGRMLGGSSSMNGMLYLRGHSSDYDHWAALGNRGWSYAELLPLFRELEDNERGADAYHGTGGPLAVSDPRYRNPVAADFLAACEAAGLPRNDDFNGASQEGAGWFQVTMKGGRRWSSADAHLSETVRARPNLTVLTGAHATRVLFDGTRATGVAYRQQGRDLRADAAAEVILAAGAVQSPQLLMLSGIGPAETLAEHGIRPVAARPGVGENLQDHLDVTVNVRTRSRTSLGLTLGALPKYLWHAVRYTLFKRGLFASNQAEIGVFTRTDPSLEVPDVQLHMINALLEDHGRKLRYGYGVSLHCCALRPHSTGRVGLNSADPFVPPRIDAGYLSDERDLDTLVKGFRMGRDLLRQPTFARHFKHEVLPGDDVQSDQAIRDFIRERAETIYHPVGTCKMGHDARAVVDDRLRVHGVEGLRVADASVMPTLIGGNTNAPSILIGAKCADMIAAERVEAPAVESEPVAAAG